MNPSFRKWPLRTALAAALTLGAGAASALTISYQDTHATSITDWSDTLTVAQWDPAAFVGYHLTAVHVYFESAVLTDMTLDNDNATAVNVIGNANSNIFGTFVGLNLASNPIANTGLVALGIDDSGDTDNPGNGGIDEVGPIAISGTDTKNFDPVALAPYIGSGSLSTAGLMTLAGYGVTGGGGNVDINVNTQANALLRVTYTYEQDTITVPEPASLALLATGLLGFGTVRRHRK